MAELPRGTVSLLFTDVEGSTQLQRRLGERYQGVVADHRWLLEQAVDAHGGTVVDRQTESFFAVFPRTRDAVKAAVAAQRALAAHAWPEDAGPRVRMGIHAGEPDLAGDRYVGLAVSRAARICAAANGGQVLLSSSARSLLADDDRATLRSLGSYRLKDFSAPEPIYQVEIDGRPERFPPLRAERGTPRARWLVLAAAFVLAAAVAGSVVLLTGGSSRPTAIGPTSVGVIDPRSGKLVDEVAIGFKSQLIAAGEGFVWVVDREGGTLTRIDPRTREARTFGIAVGAGDVPFGVAAGAGSVWVVVLRGSRQVVLQFDPDSGALRRPPIPYGSRVAAPNVFQLHPLAVGGRAVWVLDTGTNGVWRLDPQTGRARKLIEGLDARSLDYGAGALWVGGTSSVVKIDAQTGGVLGSAQIVSRSFGEIASIAYGGGAAWFATSSRPSLLQLDPESVAATDTFVVGRGPTGIAVDRGVVWVANSRDGTVSRVDSRGGGRTSTIRLGQSPGGVVAGYGQVWTSPGEPRS